ncbi:hypothetical protein [Planctomicrobium sp. SH664]|uniref:hypothetical protein n=1 Tax=Planctomicrobium sp. SH664 TaxID=3448125 RepID=UPI003F5C31BD
MRPTTSFDRFVQFIGFAEYGLPSSGDVVYNHLQNLPVYRTQIAGKTSGQAPEAVMETYQNPQDRSNSPATGPASERSQGETRAQRLARIRREIQSGTYETPEKLEAAIERMLGVLVD